MQPVSSIPKAVKQLNLFGQIITPGVENTPQSIADHRPIFSEVDPRVCDCRQQTSPARCANLELTVHPRIIWRGIDTMVEPVRCDRMVSSVRRNAKADTDTYHSFSAV